MISLSEYFGKFSDHTAVTEEIKENALNLLERVDQLMAYAIEDKVNLPINPNTQSQVSGTEYGGYRPPECTQGAQPSALNRWKGSSHKAGLGVDVYDPQNALDNWITDAILTLRSLYREHPAYTHGWCHLTTRAPRSGKRTFYPT